MLAFSYNLVWIPLCPDFHILAALLIVYRKKFSCAQRALIRNFLYIYRLVHFMNVSFFVRREVLYLGNIRFFPVLIGKTLFLWWALSSRFM